MKVKVLYDEYNTKIEKATLIFGEDVEQQFIILEVDETIEVDEDHEVTSKVVKITSIDSNTVEVENTLGKEDLRVFLNLIRSLLSQM